VRRGPVPDEKPIDRIISQVAADRRDLVKRILEEHSFAAPVVASFSTAASAAGSALAPDPAAPDPLPGETLPDPGAPR